jgi:hypothetical protein
MNNPRDKSSQEPPSQGPVDGASGDPPSDDSKRSGRAAYDERGNSVWEWQLETGVYSRDISTQRLKKLDLDDLSIAETATHPRPPGLTDPAEPKPKPGGGFNPYDNSTTGRGNVASDPYNSAAKGALKPAPEAAAPARKPSDMKKLQEWIELRKRVEQNKREDDG